MTRQFRFTGSTTAADLEHPAPEPHQPWLAEWKKENLLGLLVDPVSNDAPAWNATFTLLWMQAAISKIFGLEEVAHAASISLRRAPAVVAEEIQGLQLDDLVEAAARIDGVLVPCRQMMHRGIEFLLSAQPIDYPTVLFRWNAEGPWPEITSGVTS